MKVYFSQNKDLNIVNKSSSGGFFPTLSNYVLHKKGVIFGAVFNDEFNVEITYTDSDVSNMLGSKYVKSSVKKSFSECKGFLDEGRLVLYTGTPCQIIGLKSYLKKEYDNLITMDIICHGSPLPDVWQHYLKSFNKTIKSINFRDKRESWEQYHFTIKFEDGTEFTEKYTANRYMKLFLDNKILTEPCYTCQNAKRSTADFTVGDAWGAKFKQNMLNNHKGTSCVIVRTNKAYAVFNEIKSNLIIEPSTLDYLSTSYGYMHNYKKPADAECIKQGILNPKIAMVTIPGHNNVGNTLQAYALQSKIKDILPSSNPIVINSKYANYTDFYKNKVKFTTSGFDKSYNLIVVGSDQIWTDEEYIKAIPFEDRFLMRNCRGFVYAASFGKHRLKYTQQELSKIHDSLSKVKYVSTRELSGTLICEHYFRYNNATSVLDPTMLYDKDFYLHSIKEQECATNHGIFAYILDKNNTWTMKLNELSLKLKMPILPYNGSVEGFIHNMNTASCVVTDSYHGTVFSLIFNKPFITLRHYKRGNDRFDDLALRFDTDNRFIETLNDVDISILNQTPDCLDEIREYRKGSLDFLTKALYSL